MVEPVREVCESEARDSDVTFRVGHPGVGAVNRDVISLRASVSFGGPSGSTMVVPPPVPLPLELAVVELLETVTELDEGSCPRSVWLPSQAKRTKPGTTRAETHGINERTHPW